MSDRRNFRRSVEPEGGPLPWRRTATPEGCPTEFVWSVTIDGRTVRKSLVAVRVECGPGRSVTITPTDPKTLDDCAHDLVRSTFSGERWHP